jgi:hypothetical protein
MSEAYRPFFEGGRPLTPSDKRLWKIKHEPRMYEYRVPMPAPVVIQEEKPVEVNITAGGLLLLAFLELLKNLSNPEESGIEGQELETPQS